MNRITGTVEWAIGVEATHQWRLFEIHRQREAPGIDPIAPVASAHREHWPSGRPDEEGGVDAPLRRAGKGSVEHPVSSGTPKIGYAFELTALIVVGRPLQHQVTDGLPIGKINGPDEESVRTTLDRERVGADDHQLAFAQTFTTDLDHVGARREITSLEEAQLSLVAAPLRAHLGTCHKRRRVELTFTPALIIMAGSDPDGEFGLL